jgi:energy-coupling factor transporter ATP-binding protein EcfA2
MPPLSSPLAMVTGEPATEGDAMKSEIRDSTIRKLAEKTQKLSFATYLRSVRLERIRAFQGAALDFDFPVTALIGPNGAGKSTVLGACACLYPQVNAHSVFRKSRIGDEAMDDWLIEYVVLDRSKNAKGTIRAVLTFKDDEWHRTEEFGRAVHQFPITRTVPATENPLFMFRRKLSVYGKKKKEKVDIKKTEVPNITHVKEQAERILGRSLAAFRLYEVTFTVTKVSKRTFRYVLDDTQELEDGRQIITRRKIPVSARPPKVIRMKQLMYVGDRDGVTYSEFSFGAGEASVIRMVAEIESLPDGSLVLIEEIENGLHPLAVQRMVEYLIDVAERKAIQTIFSTHSDYALRPLPSEAIWACLDDSLQQGKLSVEALRAVAGYVDRRLAVFVEDGFAKSWLETVLREELGAHIDEIGIYPLQGDGNAVSTHRAHIKNPAVSFHSLCFIDGNSQQSEDQDARVYRLPGESPEAYVFDSVLNNLHNNIALLTVACQLSPQRQEQVKRAIQEVSRTNRDPHILFNQVGIKLGFLSESVVMGAFLSVWNQEHPKEGSEIAKAVKAALDLPPKGMSEG